MGHDCLPGTGLSVEVSVCEWGAIDVGDGHEARYVIFKNDRQW